jgi:hypothetical protein
VPSSKPRRQAPPLPERDYSDRSLLDKLGIRPGNALAVLGVEDASFLQELASRVPAFERDSVTAGLDLVLFEASSRADLGRLKALAKTIQKNGAVWVVYPKGQQHIREADVMAAGKSAGLVDNKICRFSETHTALRFVIPLANR